MDRDLLLGEPAPLGRVVEGGAIDGGVDEVLRVHVVFGGGGAGPVRTEGEHGPVIQERLEGIGAFAPLVADSFLHPAHVVGDMVGVHLGDHTELFEPGKVFGPDHLGVNHPETGEVDALISGALVGVEHESDAPGADGMDV